MEKKNKYWLRGECKDFSCGWVTLIIIPLFIRVNKENLLKFSLDCVHYLYKSNYLSMFTDTTLLHN